MIVLVLEPHLAGFRASSWLRTGASCLVMDVLGELYGVLRIEARLAVCKGGNPIHCTNASAPKVSI